MTDYVATKTADDAERHRLAAQPVLNMTAADVEQWVDDNVQTLDDVKDALKFILKVTGLSMPRRPNGRPRL